MHPSPSFVWRPPLFITLHPHLCLHPHLFSSSFPLFSASSFFASPSIFFRVLPLAPSLSLLSLSLLSQPGFDFYILCCFPLALSLMFSLILPCPLPTPALFSHLLFEACIGAVPFFPHFSLPFLLLPFLFPALAFSAITFSAIAFRYSSLGFFFASLNRLVSLLFCLTVCIPITFLKTKSPHSIFVPSSISEISPFGLFVFSLKPKMISQLTSLPSTLFTYIRKLHLPSALHQHTSDPTSRLSMHTSTDNACNNCKSHCKHHCKSHHMNNLPNKNLMKTSRPLSRMLSGMLARRSVQPPTHL